MVVAAAIGGLVAGCGSSGPSNAAPAGTKVLVALPLQVDDTGLAGYADGAADASGPDFRHFLTIAQIAERYGAPAATIAADQKVLASDGLKLSVDPTHGALTGSVTAAQAKRYFGTTLVNASGAIEPSGTPRAPAGLKGVTGVVGLEASASLPSQIAGGTGNPACPSNPPSRSSIAKLFGFNALTSGGATGAGTSIDILSTQRFESAVFENFDRCTGSSLSASTVTESTVPDTPSTGGGPEIALDSLVLMLLAPGTHLHVVQFDPSAPLAFPLINLLAAGPGPDALDITVTYCETQLKPAERALAEWLLSAIAASGTTTAAAAGDDGSSGCYPNTAPAVTYPASSRFVTSIGGASYDGSAASPQNLSVWNSPGASGGGGGTSAEIGAPPWQPSDKRRLPDLSTSAVPGAVGEIPVCATASDCAWMAVGGTSVGATVLGAAGVLLAQEIGAHQQHPRWGNLAGAIWRHVEGGGAVKDIVSGANTTHTTACCTAARGYDTASGWGLFEPDLLIGLVEGRHGS